MKESSALTYKPSSSGRPMCEQVRYVVRGTEGSFYKSEGVCLKSLFAFTRQTLWDLNNMQLADFSEMVAENRKCDGHWKQLGTTEKRPEEKLPIMDSFPVYNTQVKE